jgi:hypothetical protein
MSQSHTLDELSKMYRDASMQLNMQPLVVNAERIAQLTDVLMAIDEAVKDAPQPVSEIRRCRGITDMLYSALNYMSPEDATRWLNDAKFSAVDTASIQD